MKAEFAAHWDKPEYVVTQNVKSPFDSEYLNSLERAYGIDLECLQQSTDKTGSIYRDAMGQVSHMPTLFIDEQNNVLFFVMTD